MNAINNICDSFKTNPDGSDDVPNLLNMKEINKAHYDRIKKRNVEKQKTIPVIYNITPVCYMWMIPTRTTNMLTTTASKLIVIILSTKII
jgi:hypothetical protein